MRRPTEHLFLVLTLTLLASCRSVPPAVSPEPIVELPDRFVTATATATPSTDRWWMSFNDPELDRLVERALDSNRDLAAAAERVAMAAAQARIAGADLAPTVSASFDPARRRQNFIGLPIPGSEGRVLSSTTTTWGGALAVSWEADLWGRLRAGRDAAVAGVEAAEADLAGARLSLTAQVARAWFGLREADLQRTLAHDTLENRRLTRERIERRYRLGLRSALDLRLAISAEASAEAAVAARETVVDAARRRIDLLLSRYPDAAMSLTGSRALPAPPPPVAAGLPAELLTRRPDLAAGERRLEALGLGIDQARAALYPSLRLTGSAGRLSGEIEDLLESDFSVWSLAANLLQPLFAGGRLRAGVELAEASFRESAERYAQSVLTALAEVESALFLEGALARQHGAVERAVEQAVAARSLAEDRYDSGLGEYLLVLEAQREATAVQSQELELARRRLDARVDLFLALGGDISPPITLPATDSSTASPASTEVLHND